MRCCSNNTLSSDDIIAVVVEDEAIRIVMKGSELYGFVDKELNNHIECCSHVKEVYKISQYVTGRLIAPYLDGQTICWRDDCRQALSQPYRLPSVVML